jgi:hypothetical protein
MEYEVSFTNWGGFVTGKLGKMRKDQRFHISPTSDGRIMVQSPKSIGMFDFRTGNGVLNAKGAYFLHLNKVMGATEMEFPAEFVRACLEACPALDSETDTGTGCTLVNTVEVF